MVVTAVSFISYSAVIYINNRINGESSVFAVAVANIVSWICAVITAFLTNKAFVFCSNDWSVAVLVPEFLKFLSARIITGVFEVVAVPLLVGIGLNAKIFGIDGIISKIIVNIIVVISNYVFSKFLIFSAKKEK